MDKYLSILTNFGCHFQCPYCIVRNNGISIPKTTVEGLDNLKKIIKDGDYNIISVSGGGDPLFEYEKHINWWNRLFAIADELNIPIELHTSYKTDLVPLFPFEKCYRVVYHLQKDDNGTFISKVGDEIIRVVWVVTKDFTEKDFTEYSDWILNHFDDVDEISFRQQVGKDYEVKYYHHNFLKYGHELGLWYYIEQNDYNTYYAEGELYTEYAGFRKEKI